MSRLFKASSIGSMTIDNRFVRSATWEGLANVDGSCTSRLMDLMVELAKGGVGLIITSHAYISPNGQAGPWQLGIYSDELIPSLVKMVDAIHLANGKVVMQLAHAGNQANSSLTGQYPLGPSQIMGSNKEQYCQEMTVEDIRKTIDAFAAGTDRAIKAGFDGIQIHAAHGYLLSQFLSPFYNKRSDNYGGTIENRARFLLETIEHMRNTVGNNYPILVKINSEDFLDDGLTIDDMIQVAMMAEKAGVNTIELSGGTIGSGKYSPIRKGIADSEDNELYYEDAAKLVKEHIGIPLMLVGGIRSFSVAERVVEEGIADYISLSRPLIREPQLINRWKAGDTRKATCVSDNLCFGPIMKGNGLYCVKEKELHDTID